MSYLRIFQAKSDMQSLHLHVMDHDLIMMTPCVVGLISHDAVKSASGRAQPAVADAFLARNTH